jgi:hypothetical protein
MTTVVFDAMQAASSVNAWTSGKVGSAELPICVTAGHSDKVMRTA